MTETIIANMGMTTDMLPTEMEAHLATLKIDSKKKYRDDLWHTLVMTAVGAGLAYWAYQTVAHTVLFGFLVFSVSAVGNRISGELYQYRTKQEATALMDRLGM
jgi:hypothetical protein